MSFLIVSAQRVGGTQGMIHGDRFYQAVDEGVSYGISIGLLPLIFALLLVIRVVALTPEFCFGAKQN
jgi:hypothetical protein